MRAHAAGHGGDAAGFAEIDWCGRRVRIEVLRIAAARDDHDAPLIVFLHEGLGSVSMWKDFPQRVCQATGCRGLVYSRPGYGRSSPRAAAEHWGPDFMHRQAQQVLPALLEALAIDPVATPPWLFGHSDGASIALLYAASFPAALAGAVLLAPHIRVEPISIESIEAAGRAYRDSGLRERLAKYHADPDSAFHGWNEAWLAPAFRGWSIEDEIRAIGCPLLAVQGLDDEYGTLEQIRGIARRVPGTRLLELAGCGHSPQRDQAGAVIAATTRFMRGRRAGRAASTPG